MASPKRDFEIKIIFYLDNNGVFDYDSFYEFYNE